ncbi:hypothetical protein GMRT_10894 [Giardia muris]|uniref:Uncharacterized protein n=1 Tax=Giardia muris TaxID=5742 RepID=A0A4Z1SRU8_GIAMU|nr:hypothetical protein GMRT_10894 [Giardia muris]|eukprot:TNJ28632.1 hypothetical protein GMRT_10894 [Giardia muris]
MGSVEECFDTWDVHSPDVLAGLMALILKVRLGLIRSTDVPSSVPLMKLVKVGLTRSNKILNRAILQLVLTVASHGGSKILQPDIVGSIINAYVDFYPEALGCLIYAAPDLSPTLGQTYATLLGNHLGSSPTPTLNACTTLLVIAELERCLGFRNVQYKVPLGAVQSAQQYLQDVRFPLLRWERSTVLAAITITQFHKGAAIEASGFDFAENIFSDTLTFVKACSRQENPKGLIEFLSSLSTCRVGAIVSCLESAQSVPVILTRITNALKGAVPFLDASELEKLYRFVWKVITALPDHTAAILQELFLINNLEEGDIDPYTAARDGQDAFLAVYKPRITFDSFNATKLLRYNIELVALAFTTWRQQPAALFGYWGLVPLNRRGEASYENLSKALKELLITQQGTWCAPWLADDSRLERVFGHIPLMFTQLASLEAFSALYDNVVLPLSEIYPYYHTLCLILATLGADDIATATSEMFGADSTMDRLFSPFTDLPMYLSLEALNSSILAFSDFVQVTSGFRPVCEIRRGDETFLLRSPGFLLAFMATGYEILLKVTESATLLDDAQFLDTDVCRMLLSLLYHFEHLLEELANPEAYRTGVFRGTDHLRVYFETLKMKLLLLKILCQEVKCGTITVGFLDAAPLTAVHLLLSLFYSLALLEAEYTGPHGATLLQQVICDSEQNVRARITSSLTHVLATKPDAYRYILARDEAVRGSVLQILLFEMKLTIQSEQYVEDRSLLFAVRSPEYRAILRNSVSLAVLEENKLLDPDAAMLVDEKLMCHAVVSTCEKIRIQHQGGSSTSFIGCPGREALLSLQYVLRDLGGSKNPLVISVQKDIQELTSEIIRLSGVLIALGHWVEVLELVLTEPLALYGLLTIVEPIPQGGSSFDQLELYDMLLQSLEHVSQNPKLLPSHLALSALKGIVGHYQSHFSPDLLSAITVRVFRFYSACLPTLRAAGETVDTSPELERCFSLEKTGLLSALSLITRLLNPSKSPKECLLLARPTVSHCALLTFCTIIRELLDFIRSSQCLSHAIAGFANLVGRLIERLADCSIYLLTRDEREHCNRTHLFRLAKEAFHFMYHLLHNATDPETLPCLESLSLKSLAKLTGLLGSEASDPNLIILLCYAFRIFLRERSRKAAKPPLALFEGYREVASLIMTRENRLLLLVKQAPTPSALPLLFGGLAMLLTEFCESGIQGIEQQDNSAAARSALVAASGNASAVLRCAVFACSSFGSEDFVTKAPFRIVIPSSIDSNREVFVDIEPTTAICILLSSLTLANRTQGRLESIQGQAVNLLAQGLCQLIAYAEMEGITPERRRGIQLTAVQYLYDLVGHANNMTLELFCAQVPGEDASPRLVLRSFGWTALCECISQTTAFWGANTAATVSMYVYKLLYATHKLVESAIIVRRLPQHEKQAICRILLELLAQHLTPVLTVVNPTSQTDAQSQFLFIRVCYGLLGYILEERMVPTSLPANSTHLCLAILRHIQGLANMCYLRLSHQECPLLCHLLGLATVLICPPCMTEEVLEACMACSHIVQKFAAANKTLFGSCQYDDLMVIFLSAAQNYAPETGNAPALVPAAIQQRRRIVMQFTSGK